jgi:hypothetical protein
MAGEYTCGYITLELSLSLSIEEKVFVKVSPYYHFLLHSPKSPDYQTAKKRLLSKKKQHDTPYHETPHSDPR